MRGMERCLKCGAEQERLWKYCQKCAAEMPNWAEEWGITESRQPKWLRLGFQLMITIGVGVVGYVLFSLEYPSMPGYTVATQIMGIGLIVMAVIILYFLIPNTVKEAIKKVFTLFI